MTQEMVAGPTAYEVYAAADTTAATWQRTRTASIWQARFYALAALTAALGATTALFAALTIGALT